MPSRPNILIVTADQWRGDCLGAMDHPVVQTPHIDSLARQGTLFRRHYAGAAPCGPARACLYTGLYQMNNRVVRNGVPLDNRFDNVARAARRAGYEPTLFGYTDVTVDPRETHPADPQLSNYEGVLPGFAVRTLLPEHERPWHSWLKTRGHDNVHAETVHLPVGTEAGLVTNRPPRYSRDETQTVFLTDSFLQWLDEQRQPWFAHISYLRPHPPFVVPEPFNTMYDPHDGPALQRRETRRHEADGHPFMAYRLKRLKKSDFYPGAKGRIREWTTDDILQLRALYYGMISEVDAQMGRLFAALRTSAQWDNTVIIVTSDHGEMMGDHWMLGKGGYFDASFHIPLIIRDPVSARKSGASAVDHFTAACDIFPTLLDLMRVAPSNAVDGRSLRPLMSGREVEDWRRTAHWEFDFRGVEKQRAETHFDLPSSICNLVVIRDAAFKYVHFAGLPPLLFDLQNDPAELHNVIDHPDYRQIRIDYAERLLTWRAAHLDQTLASMEVTEDGLCSAPYPL